MNKLPDINCDVCHKNKCTRWYGFTSAVVCGSQECYAKMDNDFHEHQKEVEQDDFYNSNNLGWDSLT